MAFPLHDTHQRSVWSVMLPGQETRNRSPLTWLQTVTRRSEHTPESQACFCGGQRRSWLYHITLPYYLIPLRQEFKISPPPARLTTSKTQRSPVFPAAPPPRPPAPPKCWDYRDTHCHAGLFTWVLGIQIQVLTFV